MVEVGCVHEELNSQSGDGFGMELSWSPACRAPAMDVKPPKEESIQPI